MSQLKKRFIEKLNASLGGEALKAPSPPKALGIEALKSY